MGMFGSTTEHLNLSPIITIPHLTQLFSPQQKPHLTRGLETEPNVSREPLLFLLLAPTKQHCLVILKDRPLLLVCSFRLQNNDVELRSLSTSP